MADPAEHRASGQLKICRYFGEGPTGAALFDDHGSGLQTYERGIFSGPPASLESAPDPWPAAFSWDQRRKSMNPLPGGIDADQDVLTEIIGNVEATQPAPDGLQEWLAARYEVSAKRPAWWSGFWVGLGCCG